MIRTQVYLTEDQYQSIRLKAEREKRATAEVIRDLLAQGLSQTYKTNAGNALLRLAKLGMELQIKGPSDLSTNIDKYLYEE